MYKLKQLVGPNLDIPAPDVGTDGEIMGLMLRQYTDGERERHDLRGVVTGKDVRIGGSEGRVKATGQGLAYCIEEWFADRGATLAGRRFIVQGFGNVGSNARRDPRRPWARSCSPSTTPDGTIYNPDGIDVAELIAYVYDNPDNLRRTGARAIPGRRLIDKQDFWEVPGDIVIPAALGGEITGHGRRAAQGASWSPRARTARPRPRAIACSPSAASS